MKNKKAQPSFTSPLLQDLVSRDKANFKIQNACLAQEPAEDQAPDLYQDAGGGYNANFVFPQE
jgi:hypothetical protein